MGVEISLSFAALRSLVKAAAGKIAGRAPDPAVTARPLVHIGRATSISVPMGRIGGKVNARTTGGGSIYRVKNHGAAPALNLQIRTSRKGDAIPLGDLPPNGMKQIIGVQVDNERRFWLQWTETDGRTRTMRRVTPIP